jgi:hypothetical protein
MLDLYGEEDWEKFRSEEGGRSRKRIQAISQAGPNIEVDEHTNTPERGKETEWRQMQSFNMSAG